MHDCTHGARLSRVRIKAYFSGRRMIIARSLGRSIEQNIRVKADMIRMCDHLTDQDFAPAFAAVRGLTQPRHVSPVLKQSL